jgi:Protein of unknown function (DUF4241)
MAWPFSGIWAPLTDGVVEVLGKPIGLSVVDCGELSLPSGQLLCCDPFTEEEAVDLVIPVPAGRYPVRLTVADVSGRLDGSQLVEAYLSLILRDGKEASHEPLTPDGEEPGEGEFIGVEVATETVAMVDAEAFERSMPDPGDWEAEVFDGGPEPWYEALEDPYRIREGTANVVLPLAEAEENAILCHAGWGEGRYPVMGGFDRSGRLVAVHLDFQVVGTFD